MTSRLKIRRGRLAINYMVRKVTYIILAVVVLLVVVQVLTADRYKAMVKVVDEENKIGVNPTAEALDFGDLSKNTGATRYVSIENNGNYKIYIIVWKFGSIAELIKLSRNNFTLSPGGKERLAFEMYMPVSADKEEYSGWVWIFKTPYW